MLGFERFVEDSEFQYKHLIKLAINQKVSWITIKPLICELMTDFKAAMKLNDILFNELQLLVSKKAENQKASNQTIFVMEETVENESDNEVTYFQSSRT